MNRSTSPVVMKGKKIWKSLFIAVVLTATVIKGPVLADTVPPIDYCVGVDHPPFDQPYEGDGYSYLRVGLTLPLAYYDEGSSFTGELSGTGDSVSVTDMLDAAGQVFFIFPLYGYGEYGLTVMDDAGGMVF